MGGRQCHLHLLNTKSGYPSDRRRAGVGDLPSSFSPQGVALYAKLVLAVTTVPVCDPMTRERWVTHSCCAPPLTLVVVVVASQLTCSLQLVFPLPPLAQLVFEVTLSMAARPGPL